MWCYRDVPVFIPVIFYFFFRNNVKNDANNENITLTIFFTYIFEVKSYEVKLFKFKIKLVKFDFY